jgi:hypothetical protein
MFLVVNLKMNNQSFKVNQSQNNLVDSLSITWSNYGISGDVSLAFRNASDRWTSTIVSILVGAFKPGGIVFSGVMGVSSQLRNTAEEIKYKNNVDIRVVSMIRTAIGCYIYTTGKMYVKEELESGDRIISVSNTKPYWLGEPLNYSYPAFCRTIWYSE